MNDDEMIQTIITFLTRGHLEIDGGYPHDYLFIGETLVVASLDYNGATEIEIYQRADLLAWAKRAESYASEYDRYGNEEFYETAPPTTTT